MPQHLRLPLAVGPTGRLATVQADSTEDVAQSLAVLAATRPGERLSVPEYGSPAQLFGPGINVDELRGAAGRWEPRAAPYAIEISGTGERPVVNVRGELQ